MTRGDECPRRREQLRVNILDRFENQSGLRIKLGVNRFEWCFPVILFQRAAASTEENSESSLNGSDVGPTI